MYLCLFFFFFFSSRRRHTRCGRDWSSDVCSSDLFARAVELRRGRRSPSGPHADRASPRCLRSEEHTSELQSRPHLVFRLLLEKKKPAVEDQGFDAIQVRGGDEGRHRAALGVPEEHRAPRARSVHHGQDVVHFFFNDTATTEIYTLSLHDALPTC